MEKLISRGGEFIRHLRVKMAKSSRNYVVLSIFS